MTKKQAADHLKIGIAQISPVWLNRSGSIDKIKHYANMAAEQDCQLVVFGEALLPGYPFWIERTDGARFNSPEQKDLYAHYLEQAVQIESGHLQPLCDVASTKQMAIYVGCVERPQDRGGHSLYCSLVYIDPTGKIQSVHRKLMPTYEERLTWAIGDGHGLQVHCLGSFTVGGLNCWENWMPLSRAAVYGLGEDLHVAVWPGSDRNTSDITRFIAKESRSFVISASGLMRRSDIPEDIPCDNLIRENSEEILANGGSCLAGPDGEWLIEPQVGKEELLIATIDHCRVSEERQNFDPAGHYSRPDVTRLVVDRSRQGIVTIGNDKMS